MDRFNKLSYIISEQVTKNYSTSFYSASRLFDKDIRDGIFSIYGFVRFADEIVDSFHKFDKAYLLDKFENDYYETLKQGISLNPVLQSFQQTVKNYNISDEHVKNFFLSMKKDLQKKEYFNKSEADEYIYGSAEVVGLMCLKVFCNGNDDLYKELEKPAMRLGAAFQRVNFLRDLKDDMEILDRRYFYYFGDTFSEDVKMQIIIEIKNDFNQAIIGLRKLPRNSKLAVYVAFSYYMALLKKLEQSTARKIMNERIRISNVAKFSLLIKTIVLVNMGILK